LAGSVVVHAAVFAYMIWGGLHQSPPFEFITYQIELVSAPARLEAAEPQTSAEELVVERPPEERFL